MNLLMTLLGFAKPLFSALPGLAKGAVQQIGGYYQQKQAARATWEGEMAKASGTSWKDEWLVLVFTAPILTVVFGAWMEGICGDPRLMTAGFRMVEAIEQMGIDYATLLYTITLASFGIRGVKESAKHVRIGRQQKAAQNGHSQPESAKAHERQDHDR